MAASRAVANPVDVQNTTNTVVKMMMDTVLISGTYLIIFECLNNKAAAFISLIQNSPTI